MKKTRLLEIIREEISYALNENYSATEASCGSSIEEEQLNETPFISPSQYDIAYNEKTGEVEKGVLGNAIENAVNVIKSMGTESTPEISKIITAKKARTSPNSPPELISALTDIDDAVIAQGKTFDDPDVLKIVQKTASQPKSDLPDLSAYISGEKTFSDKLQRPQTEKAIDRILGKKDTENPAKKAEAPKAEPMDDEDAEAAKSIGSDETAQVLGKTSSAADRFANLFNAKTTEEAKEKMKELAQKANSGDQKAKAFFEKNKKIIQAYRKSKEVKV